MINKLEEYNSLIRKKSEIGKEDAVRASEILYECFNDSKDIKLLCKLLFDAYYKVLEKFIAAYLPQLSQENITDLCLEFEGGMRVAKPVATGLKHSFTLLAGAYNLNMFDDSMLNLLKQTIGYAQQGGFAKAKCDALKSHLLKATNGDILAVDYSSWNSAELSRLEAYLQAALPDLDKLKYRERVYQWRAAHNMTAVTATVESPPTATVPKVAVTEKVIYAITPEMVAELQTLYQNAFEKNNIFKEKDATISEQRAILLDLQQEIQAATNKIAELGVAIAEKEATVKDLDDRLRNVFSWEERSRKQELLTLKKDISSALKLRYDDYQALLSMPLSTDSYAFSKATITQIFKILKRYDIEV